MSNKDVTVDITPVLEALAARLDRIEAKLDDHLERVSKAEKDIEWLRGHLRISTAVFLAVVGGLGTLLLNTLFPGSGK